VKSLLRILEEDVRVVLVAVEVEKAEVEALGVFAVLA
jgi:hypothetical protein